MQGDRAGRLSRRELIAGALVTGGAVSIATAAPALADAPVTDASLLTAALGMERLTVLAYRHVINLPAVGAEPRRLLREMLRHNRAHARSLEVELKALGITIPAPPTKLAEVDQELSKHGMSGTLATVNTLKDAIQYLLDAEALCEGAYYAAVASLSATGPLVRCAQSLGSDAQHSALLAEILYPTQVTQYVPYWYVAGVS